MTNLTDMLSKIETTETAKEVTDSDINLESVLKRVHLDDIAPQSENQSNTQEKKENSKAPLLDNSHRFLRLISDRSGQSIIMLVLLLLITG